MEERYGHTVVVTSTMVAQSLMCFKPGALPERNNAGLCVLLVFKNLTHLDGLLEWP